MASDPYKPVRQDLSNRLSRLLGDRVPDREEVARVVRRCGDLIQQWEKRKGLSNPDGSCTTLAAGCEENDVLRAVRIQVKLLLQDGARSSQVMAVLMAGLVGGLETFQAAAQRLSLALKPLPSSDVAEHAAQEQADLVTSIDAALEEDANGATN